MKRVVAALAGGWLAWTLMADPSRGGTLSLEGGPVTGGGVAKAGTYEVTAAAGQTPTGTFTGGTFQLRGGLIGVVVVPGDVAIDIQLADSNVVLTWPSSAVAAGYVLQFQPQLGGEVSWQTVTPAPVGNTYTTPFNQPMRYFRLKKQ